jgi:hypothetical protein
MKIISTFPAGEDFNKARALIERLSLPHEIISPDPGYKKVGFPAVVNRFLKENTGKTRML